LDAADAIRRKRQRAIALTEQFLRSTFLDMFGDPVNNPKEWDVMPLGDVGEVQGGVQVSVKRSANPVELPYLRVANVFRDRLKLDEIKTIRVTVSEQKRVLLKNKDLLIVEGHGNREEIGRSAVWDGSIKSCIHQNHLIRVRVNEKLAYSQYISAFINSPGGRRQLLRSSNTTSGLNTISTSTVKATQVLVPPKAEQQKFLDVLHTVFGLNRQLFANQTHSNNLFNSLVQRAFRGEL